MRQFIIAYGYGMGGLWGLMDARSEMEILAKYPELTVVTQRPQWITEEKLETFERHSIDDEPAGLLLVVLADRRTTRGEEASDN